MFSSKEESQLGSRHRAMMQTESIHAGTNIQQTSKGLQETERVHKQAQVIT
jgi:hypothetical protein